jgi:hypothetical protein
MDWINSCLLNSGSFYFLFVPDKKTQRLNVVVDVGVIVDLNFVEYKIVLDENTF